MYWIKLIKEIRIWWLARKVALANQSELEEFGVRVDWVGRPYVLSQLRKYDEILLRLQLSDVLYPEFEKIPGESAYLLVLTPEMEYLDWLRFILNTLGWIAGYYGVVALHNIIEKKFAINIVQEIISLF
jgi:hypothetical protein